MYSLSQTIKRYLSKTTQKTAKLDTRLRLIRVNVVLYNFIEMFRPQCIQILEPK